MPAPSDVTRPWCNAYPPGVPPAYAYPVVPVTRFLDDAARDFPVSDALRLSTRAWSWSDLRDLVDRAAARFADLGVVAGDRVGLVAPTTPAAVVASFATWRLGAVLVPLDPSLPTAELGARLLDVEPSVIVTDVIALDAVLAVRPRLRQLRHVVVTDPVRWVNPRRRLVGTVLGGLRGRRVMRPDDDVLAFDALLDGGPALIRQTATTPSTPAAILFTGGTTGAGRGVVLTHGNLVANAFQTRLWVPDVRSGHEVILGALPLWHAYGLTSVLLTGALVGATIVLVPRPDAASLLDAIDAERPTLFPGVPRMYQALADHPGASRRDLSSLRVAVTGGTPLEPSTIAAFEGIAPGVRLRQGYGQSETGPLTHACPVYGAVDEDSVGLPVTDTVAIIRRLDAPDERADVGEVGEMLVAGPQVMAGYWGGPGVPLDEPGTWHATGDLATVDTSGVFRVLGRITDLVHRRGGQRMLPSVAEQALLQHPGVERAVVVGVDTATVGEEVAVAIVVARRGHRLKVADLEAHVREHLDEAAQPDAIVLRDALPETMLGKVLRRALRAELVGEYGDPAAALAPGSGADAPADQEATS